MDCGNWLRWQIDYLLLLQNFRDTSGHILDKFFLFITTFGEMFIAIVVICLFYWVINKKIGLFLLWNYIFGFIVNTIAKTTACIYRPWILDLKVKPLAEAIPAATGYSFPSGHTAGAMSIWGGLAIAYWKNKIIRYSCIILVFLIMISRNYVGVHTPQDVIVSFVISCVIIFCSYKLINWEEKGGKRDIVIALSVSIITILSLLYINLKCYPIHYLFGKVLYDPKPTVLETIIKSGFIFGSFFGWIIEKRYVNFLPQNGTIAKKVIRSIVGLILLFGLHGVTKILENVGCNTFIFVQYTILGLFITFIYPFIIKKYNL